MDSTALSCMAVLGLLVFGLGLSISVVRFRCGTNSGSEENPADSLYKLVRAHAIRLNTRPSSRCSFFTSERDHLPCRPYH